MAMLCNLMRLMPPALAIGGMKRRSTAPIVTGSGAFLAGRTRKDGLDFFQPHLSSPSSSTPFRLIATYRAFVASNRNGAPHPAHLRDGRQERQRRRQAEQPAAVRFRLRLRRWRQHGFRRALLGKALREPEALLRLKWRFTSILLSAFSELLRSTASSNKSSHAGASPLLPGHHPPSTSCVLVECSWSRAELRLYRLNLIAVICAQWICMTSHQSMLRTLPPLL